MALCSPCRQRGVCRCQRACHIGDMATKRLPRPRDPIQLGKLIVDIATGQVQEPEETPAEERARESGKKGGQVRFRRLTPEERRAIAQKGARSRWGKVRAAQDEKEPS